MEVRRLAETDAERLVGPVFETQVHKKEGVTEAFDGDRRIGVSEILFAPGERTTLHEHTIRQILYITGGEGVVVAGDERHRLTEGDLISIPPEVEHWHGAASDTPFRHLSMVIRDPEHDGTIALEEPDGRRTEE